MQDASGMLPIIVDQSFNRLCVVDDFISFIWSRRYFDVGDFELVISMASPNRQYMLEGNYVVRDGIGEAGIIEHVGITVDLTGQETMVITGRFLSSIIGRRIIAQQTQVSGTIEACVKKLINENAISPQNSARRLPGLQYGTWSIPATTMQQQFTGKNLLEVLQDICKTYNIGFRVDLTDTNAFSLVLYNGIDRSYAQSANPYVVFSNEYDNLASSDYSEDYQSVVTDVLVAGEGEGLNRKTQWASSGSARGLDRYELYVDARNASTNNGEISDAVYYAQLREEGLENITSVVQAFAGEVFLTNMELGTDFNVGDVCVIENRKWGITANARLIEVIESVGEDGTYSVVPTFDIGAATIINTDTTGYIETEYNMEIMTEQDSGPLMLETAEYDAENSPYKNALKISELDEASESDIQDSNWFVMAQVANTVKVTWATIVSKLKSIFLPLTGGTLSGSLSLSSGGVFTNTAAFVIYDSRLNRAGGVSANTYSAVHGIRDKNGEPIGYVQATQYPSGTTGLRLYAANEKEDGTEVGNAFEVQVKKDGSRAYYVTDAAAFRNGINAQVAGSYATTNNAGAINTAGGNGNHFLVGGMVTSEGTYKGHRTFLAMSENGIFGWDGTGEKTIWNLPITRTTSTTAITAASGVTITKQEITRRSNVVMLRVQATIAAAKSANTSVTIGTVASGWRPAMDIFAGVWAVGSWDGYVSSSGAIVVRPKAAIASNTSVVVSATYVLA